MIESPIIQEIVAEALHGAILNLLKRRFGDVPPDVETQMRSVQDNERLMELNAIAGSCSNVDDFKQALS